MSLSDKLTALGAKSHKEMNPPLWKGPLEDGITFSLLSRFIQCRERFRILTMEGLRPKDQFNHRLEYGNMWHLCEEVYHTTDSLQEALTALLGYARKLCDRYRMAQEEINHWYEVCKLQFPLYLDYWSQKNPDTDSKALLSEYTFSVLYTLPSGRSVRLRGKWDSIHLKDHCIWLKENKSKGDIDERNIQRQLTFDLQTMMYLVALETEQRRLDDSMVKARTSYRDGQYRCFYPIKGVIYNVVRRPLSGGRHTVRRHQPTKKNPHGESHADFYKRVEGLIFEDPDYFFMRWNIEVTPNDIERFKGECLNPILENLCDWWDWASKWQLNTATTKEFGGVHWRHPFGVYNAMDEGGSSELDSYFETGMTHGLERTNNLFPELT